MKYKYLLSAIKFSKILDFGKEFLISQKWDIPAKFKMFRLPYLLDF